MIVRRFYWNTKGQDVQHISHVTPSWRRCTGVEIKFHPRLRIPYKPLNYAASFMLAHYFMSTFFVQKPYTRIHISCRLQTTWLWHYCDTFLPHFLFVSGDHVNVVFAGISLVITKTWPNHLHLSLFILMQISHSCCLVSGVGDGFRPIHVQ